LAKVLLRLSELQIISLFSGAGGLDLGFINAGFKIIWANDTDTESCQTYRANIGDHIVEKSIEAVSDSDIPATDGVIGGFPCQGFSVANRNRKVSDERNELYRHFVRIVDKKNPVFFVAENVKGILSLGKGAVIEKIKNDFSESGQFGYRIYAQLFNTADYGVPQFRERVILFGVRNDISLSNNYFPPDQTHHDPHELALTGRTWVTIGEALKDVPEPGQAHDLPNHTGTKYKLRFNNYLGHRFVDPNKPSPTITARGDNRGGVVIIHHPSNKRRLTVREAALIQSFPKHFCFLGSNSSAYRQIGNAVPPLFAYAIANAVKATLQEASICASGEDRAGASRCLESLTSENRLMSTSGGGWKSNP
jgi:DNA (cytosine-5)-methyltransferase 1